mmetsp:Transcript_2712/g.3737  ORF Transcript_2712/g.3737 Transcript_2712/m.3737 type:complete len:160 (-) Transcript_2712:347-826(-)
MIHQQQHQQQQQQQHHPQLQQGRRGGINSTGAMAMQARLDPVSALSKTLDKIDNRGGGGASAPWGAPVGANPIRPNPFQGRDSQEAKVAPYASVASFNKRSGRFSSSGNETYFERKGVPVNREERMMSHYFDHDSWQDQMNRAKQTAARSNANTKRRRR